MHNPNASRTNIMGGSIARMHKTILPLTSGHTPPNRCPQQQQCPQQCLPNAYYSPGGTAWQQPTPPAQYGGMPQANGHLSPANNHGHAGVSTRPRNDDECRTVPSLCWKYTNDADGPTADNGTHVDEPLCPEPAQTDAGVFLTSRGG
jgi:hypothetical protein